jgi:hypothetical protein
VAKEDHEDEDPRNFQVPETKGEHAVEGSEIEYIVYAKFLKTNKVNIDMKDKPKFKNIRDYCNE